MTKQGFVYILSNQHNSVLYTGMTSNLHQRVYQHKNRLIKGFSKKYNCNKLVWYEHGNSIESAIAREKQIKAGSRNTKIRLIEKMNPSWQDLSENWYS